MDPCITSSGSRTSIRYASCERLYDEMGSTGQRESATYRTGTNGPGFNLLVCELGSLPIFLELVLGLACSFQSFISFA